ncbi:MAG: prohibitin family protein [Bacteroidota bacterium]
MKKKSFTLPIIIVGLVIIIILVVSSSYILQPGERAVIFRPYTTGLDKENVVGEGFHVVGPWNDFIVYDVKEQQREETMDVLDKNGLSVNVDISVRFNPMYDRIGFLHEIFGVEYITRLVVPEVRSSVRKVMGRYSAEEIYSTKRKEVEDAIYDETKLVLNENNIQMTALLIRSINLPPDIKGAIESKLTQEQEALAYKFRLEKETSEAERKRIAAEGEAKANDIVNSSLSDKLLKMRGIEATLELSKSPNTKIIIIGSGSDGLPLILNAN